MSEIHDGHCWIPPSMDAVLFFRQSVRPTNLATRARRRRPHTCWTCSVEASNHSYASPKQDSSPLRKEKHAMRQGSSSPPYVPPGRDPSEGRDGTSPHLSATKANFPNRAYHGTRRRRRRDVSFACQQLSIALLLTVPCGTAE